MDFRNSCIYDIDEFIPELFMTGNYKTFRVVTFRLY